MDHLNQRAADRVVKAIELRIADGQLQDNDALPAERDLMEEFGSSRTVIREAISLLSTRGLIEAKPRHRPIVKKPNFNTVISATDMVARQMLNDENGIKNLYHSRVFVEAGLVRNAAKFATRDHISDLKTALKANENAVQSSQEFYKTDIAFHDVFYQMSDNPIFPAINLGYVSWLAPHWERMESSTERNQRNFIAHKAIYDAILERDPDRAEEALRVHLAHAWEFVKDTF